MSLDLETVAVDPDAAYDIVGVLNRGRGLLRRAPMPGSDTAYKNLNVIRPRQVVYSRLKAFEGAITVVPDDRPESFASQEFPTFTCGPSLLPEYFALHTTTVALWERLQGLSTGMGGRRERVKPVDFLTIRIPLPQLAEQRRIVDLVSSVDATIAGLVSEALQSEGLGSALAEDLLRDVERVPADRHIVKIDGGKSPQTTNVAPTASEEGVLKVSAVTPFEFLPTESKALLPDTTLPFSCGVRPGDVLITRANTPQRVGAVCRVPEGVRDGLFLSDKTLRLTPSPDLDPNFLVVAMSLASARDHLTGSATGTSASMFNISQGKIRATPIPVPEWSAQQRIADTVMSARQVAQEVWSEHERTRAMRASLLTSLLTQGTEVAKAYDRFLEKVA